MPFIFIILDFNDSFLFHLLQNHYYRRSFHKGGFIMGQCSLLGFSWDRKVQGNFPGDILQEEVSLNPPSHSTTVKIFQHSQNTFNVASTKYLS